MHNRKTPNSNLTLATVVCALVLSGCGGGNAGGGGGNGGGPKASISLISPSNMMVGVPISQVTIFGKGFDSQSQVLVDGAPALLTVFLDATTLEGDLPTSFFTAVGTHQFSVQTSNGKITNSLPFAVYTPQPGPQLMQAFPGFLVGDFAADPAFTVAADVNGDGLSDVVMQGPALMNSSGSIAIFYGQADGSLSTVQYLPTSSTPLSLAAGDVNGDGNTDFVFFQTSNGNLVLTTWLGDGHGNFPQTVAQQSSVSVVSKPFLVDLDGDGQLDYVIAIGTSVLNVDSLVWFQNIGGGNFAAPVTLATTTLDLSNFSIADFNDDGRPDILYAVPGSPEFFHILTNQGGGQFKDQVVTGLNGIMGSADIIDFNLDGIPDLVVQVPTGNVTMYSFVGHGNGSFTQVGSVSYGQNGFRVYQFVAGDFDHDGLPDLAGINGETEPSHVLYLFGDGHGNFTTQEVVGPMGVAIVKGDFNGDGIPDVVVPDRFNFISLALGRTDRNFPSAVSLSPATAIGVAVGDVNGDGFPEILVAGDTILGVPSTLFLNQGNDSFQVAAYLDPGAFELHDLTGRGVADLIGGHGSSLIIWPNDGTLNFSSSPITLPQPMSNIMIADVDGDGHADILSTGQIFYGDGSYQFTPISEANLAFPYALGDFNRDGKLDIESGIYTFLNMGNRTYKAIRTDTAAGDGAMVAVGDFNGDGIDDLAIAFFNTMYISIWYGAGDGTFYHATSLDPGEYVGAIAAGDFNGDGRPDLAVGLLGSHQACLLLNTGNGQFTRSFFATGASTVGMLSADLNRDGKPDLIFGNFQLGFRPANLDVVFHK